MFTVKVNLGRVVLALSLLTFSSKVYDPRIYECGLMLNPFSKMALKQSYELHIILTYTPNTMLQAAISDK